MTGGSATPRAHTSCKALRKKSFGSSRRCASGSASDMCDLSLKQTRRAPCHSYGFAHVLPGEGYSGASGGCAFLRIRIEKRSTSYRPVNPPFHRTPYRSSCTVFRAIKARLVLRRPLSQPRTKKDSHDHVWDISSHPYVHRETCPRAAL